MRSRPEAKSPTESPNEAAHRRQSESLPMPAQEHRAQSRTRQLSAHEITLPHPHWPEASTSVETRIVVVLRGKALELHRTGPASKPDLPSKDDIDIDLFVPDTSNEAAYTTSPEQAGFQVPTCEPAWCGHRLFAEGGASRRSARLKPGLPSSSGA